MTRELTHMEAIAIDRLKRLGRRWPKDLMLRSNKGSWRCCSLGSGKEDPVGCEIITTIPGIRNDGGWRS